MDALPGHIQALGNLLMGVFGFDIYVIQPRRVDDMDGARRRRVAEAKRRAPHLARLGDAGVGVLRRERIETQDAICDRTAKLNGLIKRNGHHLNASGALA